LPTDDQQPHAPHYYGGQAVIEGVMMRGQTTWAVAVRRPSGEIYLERHLVSDFPQRRPIFTKPMFRGMYGLVDALTIGTKALTISANQSVEEEEQLSGKQMGGSLLMALVLFIGVFIVLPNVGLAALRDNVFGGSEFVYHVVESIVRVFIFLGYLGAISLLADIRRVFAYHGGEHKTIAAWEHDEPLQPADVQPYSTLHVRCGTNFLLLVMVIAMFVYTLAGTLVPPSDDIGTLAYAAYQILLRIVLLPVVAGLAYEGLRLGAGKEDSNLLVRAMMKPGLWLQKITTKPPDDGMVEVAIRAFEAVVPSGELAGRTTDLPSPVVWGPDDAEPGRFGRPVEGTPSPAPAADVDPDGPPSEPLT
jgi:uncharacterized protein YqhQ